MGNTNEHNAAVQQAVTQLRREMESQFAKSRDERRRMDQKFDRLSEDVQEVGRKVGAVLEAIRQVGRQLERSARSDRAQAELDRLKESREQRFGGYQKVRGMARSLASGSLQTHLDHSTIERFAVDLKGVDPMIYAPDFWLSSVVVALVAELRGDTDRGNTALSISTAEDRPKIELFTGLLAAYRGRGSEAARCISHYLETTDPKALNLEFPHVLNALVEGELGDAPRSYAAQALRRWGIELDLRPDIADSAYAAQTEACHQRLLTHHTPLPAERYPTLRVLTGDHEWAELEEMWRMSTACGGVSAELARRLDMEVRTSNTSTSHPHTKRALDALINQPSADEQRLRQAIEWHERVRDNGDLAVAKPPPDGPPTIDLPTLLTTLALAPESRGVGIATQRFALACAGGWIEHAARSLTTEALNRRRVGIRLGDGHPWSGELRMVTAVQRAQAVDRLVEEVGRARRPASVVPMAAVSMGLVALGAMPAVFGLIWLSDKAVVAVVAVAVVICVLVTAASGRVAHLRKRDALEERRRTRAEIDAAAKEYARFLADCGQEAQAGLDRLQKLLADLESEPRR